eukprot:6476705-Amphidinium_carterae.1
MTLHCALRVSMIVPLVAMAIVLEGCDGQATRHAIGYWRQQPNHLKRSGLAPHATQGWGPTMTGSCRSDLGGYAPRRVPGVCCSGGCLPSVEALQCSGHGRCESFQLASGTQVNSTGSLLLCKCSESWAGPECAQPRKSQRTTFILALFLGCLGLSFAYNLLLPLPYQNEGRRSRKALSTRTHQK